MKNLIFRKQVNLLLEILPIALKDERLALKGGTAINLFINNMPRLSVDIDLTYLPIEDRNTTLINISIIMNQMLEELEKQKNTKASLKHTKDNIAKQIVVQKDGILIKIELNLVIRGSIYAPKICTLSDETQNAFQKFIEAKTLSIEDLYGGKFCAALDRGHPRDLYDIIIFFQNYNMNAKIKNAFIFYLLSSNRPIVELLQPGQLYNFEYLFKSEFAGMVNNEISVDELLNARIMLSKKINSNLSNNDKEFLLSFKSGEPNWDLFPFANLKDMPSVKWKLSNIRNMNKEKHKDSIKKLRNFLESM